MGCCFSRNAGSGTSSAGSSTIRRKSEYQQELIPQSTKICTKAGRNGLRAGSIGSSAIKPGRNGYRAG
ncbi:hypothetical protein MAM1_0039d02786 [Mucor ambiguus]|uniref:Uncharacterized protein n=1 Tax=Mucor ambiguus TaxID=91626 RepID=A0A0C9MN24_9FUNG|nr:hypothetical protein MAM1_0039d02786 [Mucor ambiguus]